MKKGFVFICFLLAGSILNAQDMILHDPVSAKVFNSERYSGMKGTPFLYEKWTKGMATSQEGTYKSLELKLDAFTNTVFFNKDDEPYEFQSPILRFVLTPKENDSSSYQYFIKGLSGPSLQPDQFVQVLAEGKLSLYKSDIKLVSDVNEINRGVLKAFSTATRFYIKKKETVSLIKPGKDELLPFVNDQQEKIEAFIKEKKLNPKKEQDLKSIIQYYNSL